MALLNINGITTKEHIDQLQITESTQVSDEKSHQHNNIEIAVDTILRNIGEDPSREGLLKTPNRVARMFDELTAGYHIDPVKLINGAIFSVDYDEMVVVTDIDFHSLCEHHMLPFYGRAHV
nr:GTP cyclohydrolase I [Chloroflexota bacterium]